MHCSPVVGLPLWVQVNHYDLTSTPFYSLSKPHNLTNQIIYVFLAVHDGPLKAVVYSVGVLVKCF